MGGNMKTTIDIADSLLDRAKRAARLANITLRELTEEGLELALQRRSQTTRPHVQFVTFRGAEGAPAPNLDWEQLREMVYPAPEK